MPIFKKTTTLLSFAAVSLLFSGATQLKLGKSYTQSESLSPATVEANSATEPRPQGRYVFDDSGVALTQSLQDVRYQEFAQAIETFLASLSEEQQTALVQPFDHPFRTRAFCYVLARCKEDYVGLRMRDLNSAQKVAFNNVLMKGFSGAGYSRAIQIMNREWLVEETENAHRADPERYPTVGSPLVAAWTPPLERSAPDFYIAFFGEPASMDPWGLRFEGHHLSLNLTFGGEGEPATVGTAPMFFGSSPMIIPESPAVAEGEETPYPQWQQQEGQQLLHRETWLGRSFLQSLDAATRQAGQWSELPDVVLAGGAEVPLDAASFLAGEQAGIPVAELSPLQQSLLFEFALEFLHLQASQNIDEAAFKANLANARVWWYGDIEDEQADLYLRVQSDRYLVEILQSNTFAVVSEVDSNHVHASFRDLTSDWDHNSLGAHIHNYHESAVVH